MIFEPLKAFRTDYDGCEIVVLVDISTGTVLAQDGAVKWPQEQLDDLCALAAHVLALGTDEDEARAAESAMLARATGCHTFTRAAPGASEVLCCVFAPGADLAGVFEVSLALCADLLETDQKASLP